MLAYKTCVPIFVLLFLHCFYTHPSENSLNCYVPDLLKKLIHANVMELSHIESGIFEHSREATILQVENFQQQI